MEAIYIRLKKTKEPITHAYDREGHWNIAYTIRDIYFYPSVEEANNELNTLKYKSRLEVSVIDIPLLGNDPTLYYAAYIHTKGSGCKLSDDLEYVALFKCKDKKKMNDYKQCSFGTDVDEINVLKCLALDREFDMDTFPSEFILKSIEEVNIKGSMLNVTLHDIRLIYANTLEQALSQFDDLVNSHYIVC